MTKERHDEFSTIVRSPGMALRSFVSSFTKSFNASSLSHFRITSPRIPHLMRSRPAWMTLHYKSPPFYGTTCAASAFASRSFKTIVGALFPPSWFPKKKKTCVQMDFWHSVGTPRLLCCMKPVGLPARHAMRTPWSIRYMRPIVQLLLSC